MKKIVCVLGTRPQLIKHSVLLDELQKHFEVDSVYTGQHYQFELNELLKKDLFTQHDFVNLTLAFNHSPAKRLGEMISKVSNYLETAHADAVLVYGDTDSTLAGALAAYKSGIKLIHVEAGERSYNPSMPEEHNRIITDNLSNILFCVSQNGIKNLKAENNKSIILFCGDLMKDLVLKKSAMLLQAPLQEDYALATIHRNYNKNNPEKLEQLFLQLAKLPFKVLFPVHPSTAQTIEDLIEKNDALGNIHFLSPLSYTDSVHYQKFAKAIFTDSGGIQKEAYWLKRPCITIRKETEWIDTLQGNWNQLAYDDLSIIPALLNTPRSHYDDQLYGNGNAATTITRHLLNLV